MNNQDIAKHSAAMLDLFEAEQQRILLLDPKERAMQHNYQKTMAVCYELRTFIRSIDAKPSAVLEAAPASSAMAMQAENKTLRELVETLYDAECDCDACNSARDFLQSQQSPVQASDAGRHG
jgi:hypothetical protein